MGCSQYFSRRSECEDMNTPCRQAVIEARDLVVGFGDQVVLNHLSITLRHGEILGVVGASGSGKSVLLRTLIGLIPKREGIISFAGLQLKDAAEPGATAFARRRGILFQQGALFSSLTVRQNVQFPMREALHLSDRLLDELATVKLEMVGLHARDGDKFPAEISGGMTKRVALARALALDPDIVFLDEPTSGLDPISAEEFDVLIRALQQTLGLTVFMVTHDLDSLHTVCDRIAVLADGKVVTDGPMTMMLASEHPWVKSYFRGTRTRNRAKLTGQPWKPAPPMH